MNENKGRWSWLLPLLLSALALAATAFAAYSHNDKELNGRIISVEVQQKNDLKAIERVEQKVDRIEMKLDRAIERKR